MHSDQPALILLLTAGRYRDLLAQFAHEKPEESPTQFTAWLFAQGHLTAAQYREVLTRRQVQVRPQPPPDLHHHHDLGRLGQGTMGVVHVMQEQALGRTVALKQVRADDTSNAVARFYREAQITAQLEHPAIVPVYRLKPAADGGLAYTMKLIDGVTLTAHLDQLRARPPQERPLSERIRQFIRICEAISYAHRRGIIHRDLKPDNIMIGPSGEVYVMDWGLARRLDEAEPSNPLVPPPATAQMTAAGAVMGTAAYMSPEQARGMPLTPAADQYALGLLLQELVTLAAAIAETSWEAALKKAMFGYRRVPKPPSGQGAIPRELRAIMSRCLALEPEDRYRDVAALIDDLHRLTDGHAVQTSPDSPAQRMARWFAHHRELTLLLVVGLLLAIFATSTGFLYREKQARLAAEDHEESLARILTITAGQSQRIERHLLRYEGLTMSLATAAVQALSHSPEGTPTFYTDLDFADPQTAPAELTASSRYQRSISTRWPVFKPVPGSDTATMLPLMQQLASIRQVFRLAMLRSRGEAAVTLPEPQAVELITQRGTPLVWAYVSLEEGLHMSYPGQSGYPDDYDPRRQSWYEETVGTTGPRWGEPYRDVLGQGMLLPCTMSLLDAEHRFRGVAGVELTLETIIDDLMAMPLVSGIRETLLLDRQGQVLVRSSHRPSSAEDAQPHLPFSSAETVRTVVARGSGHMLSESDGLVVFDRLGSVGWFYVVTGDPEAMLGQ